MDPLFGQLCGLVCCMGSTLGIVAVVVVTVVRSSPDRRAAIEATWPQFAHRPDLKVRYGAGVWSTTIEGREVRLACRRHLDELQLRTPFAFRAYSSGATGDRATRQVPGGRSLYSAEPEALDAWLENEGVADAVGRLLAVPLVDRLEVAPEGVSVYLRAQPADPAAAAALLADLVRLSPG